MITKKTLKSLALLAGMSFIGYAVSAQAVDPKESAQKETARIKTNVQGITTDEESRILAVEQDYANSIEGVRTYTGSDDKDGMRKELRNTRDSKIKAILTSDQYAQYVTMEKNQK